MWTGEGFHSETLKHGWQCMFIGIYLGATYSCVEVSQNDRGEIASFHQGSRTTPFYVPLTDAERPRGDVAK